VFVEQSVLLLTSLASLASLASLVAYHPGLVTGHVLSCHVLLHGHSSLLEWCVVIYDLMCVDSGFHHMLA
jgi:hypothetical protein